MEYERDSRPLQRVISGPPIRPGSLKLARRFGWTWTVQFGFNGFHRAPKTVSRREYSEGGGLTCGGREVSRALRVSKPLSLVAFP
eukprot:scaffold780_cov99-Isochrysis_galbana.AAC.2